MAVHQHIVFGTVLNMALIENYDLEEKIVNHNSVDSFYNGNRLDQHGYWIGVRIDTLKDGENTSLDDVLATFKEQEVAHRELFNTLLTQFKKDKAIESICQEEFNALIGQLKEPSMLFIPETE